MRKHARTVTQSVWRKRRERRHPSSWRRPSQHAHVTSLSGHFFILLFEPFQNPPPRRLLRFAQQRETPQRLFLWFTPELALNPPVRQNCVSDKRKRMEQKRSFPSLFFFFFPPSRDHLIYCSRCGASSDTFYWTKKKVWICWEDHVLWGGTLQKRENNLKCLTVICGSDTKEHFAFRH